MKVITGKFMTWLMGLTRIMRYLVIAVLVHVGLLAILGSIKIVAILPKIVASFEGTALPPPAKPEEPDPFAAFRDFDYNGPTLGGGGGTPGKGPGGIPTAAGTTPTEYKASIMNPDASSDSQVAEVIGVVSESATAVARLQGSPGGVAAPTTGLGEGKFGTSGVRGPGGGGFGQRVGPMRAQSIARFKGSADTEKAVLAALRWLKQHQEANGSWICGKNAPAGTALAVLAFLGHGETPDSEEFGPTVNKGLAFLVSQFGADGFVAGKNMYAQGAATLALSEAFGMTQSPAVKEPLDRAINAICTAQKVPKKESKHTGGWRYGPTAADADTSVSGWLIMALKSAKLAGMSVPEGSFEMASKYLWNMHNGEGFSYSGAAATPNMTAVGVLCQQFLGHGDDKRVKTALDYLKEQKVEWAQAKGWPMYGWYYTTQAMFQGGGSYWEYWNKQIRDTMVKNQAEDGHWDVPPNSGEKAGPVYSTTLGCLMLEVYYRYLPIYQELEKKSLPPMPPSTPSGAAKPPASG